MCSCWSGLGIYIWRFDWLDSRRRQAEGPTAGKAVANGGGLGWWNRQAETCTHRISHMFHLIFGRRPPGTGTWKTRDGDLTNPQRAGRTRKSARHCLPAGWDSCDNFAPTNYLTLTKHCNFAARSLRNAHCSLPREAIPLIAAFGHPPRNCHAWTSPTGIAYTCLVSKSSQTRACKCRRGQTLNVAFVKSPESHHFSGLAAAASKPFIGPNQRRTKNCIPIVRHRTHLTKHDRFGRCNINKRGCKW